MFTSRLFTALKWKRDEVAVSAALSPDFLSGILIKCLPAVRKLNREKYYPRQTIDKVPPILNEPMKHSCGPCLLESRKYKVSFKSPVTLKSKTASPAKALSPSNGYTLGGWLCNLVRVSPCRYTAIGCPK